MKSLRLTLSLLCTAALVCSVASADELKLKDGTKVVGRIVGFENDAFKVEMSYGFALVLREKVVSIVMSPENGKGAPAKKPEPPKQTEPPAPTPAAAATPPPAATPAPAPEPKIREEVEGNLYTNHVYGFRLYKPPSWQLIEGAPRSVPNAVMAMGTSDESTLLVVGRESLRGTLDAQAATTEQRLGQIYENYRSLEEERTTVAGRPAVARRFRGTIQGKDWSGRIIWVARGNDVFTLFGMTTAESDLIQIQENVIARTIASLVFLR